MCDDVLSESVTSTAVVRLPSLAEERRVGSKQVERKRVLLGHQRARKIAKLIEVLQLGRQSTVHAKDPATDERARRHPVERLLKTKIKRRSRSKGTYVELVPKDVVVVSAHDLCLEPIDAVDVLRLVIAAQQKELVRISDLVA